MSSQPQELTIDEVKQCLEGAGFDTEEDMPEDYMRSCYDAIKSSEVSFGEERSGKDSPEVASPQKSRSPAKVQVNEEKAPGGAAESIFKPREWITRRKNPPQAPQTQVQEILIKNDEPEVKPDKNGKASLLKKTHKQIRSEFDDIDPFDCAPFKQRVEIKTHQPIYGTPIYCDPKILKVPFKDRFALIYSMHQAYAIALQKIQTRSKEYVPWPSPISASKSAKSDTTDESPRSEPVLSQEVEEVYVSKKGRMIKRKLYTEATEDEVGCKTTTKSPEMPRKKQAVSTDDLMKKSRLFGDPLKETARGRKIFEKVTEEDKKRRAKEEEMNKFVLSIAEPIASSDEEFQNTPETEVEFPRIVVPPPSRKPIKRKLTSKHANEHTSKETTTTRTFLSESTCPICLKKFSNNDLLEHASSCGEFEENPTTKKSTNTTNTLLCDYCLKVFTSLPDCETHKKICPEKGMSD